MVVSCQKKIRKIFFETPSIDNDMFDGTIESYITIYLMGTQQAVPSEFMKKRKIILKIMFYFCCSTRQPPWATDLSHLSKTSGRKSEGAPNRPKCVLMGPSSHRIGRNRMVERLCTQYTLWPILNDDGPISAGLGRFGAPSTCTSDFRPLIFLKCQKSVAQGAWRVCQQK